MLFPDVQFPIRRLLPELKFSNALSGKGTHKIFCEIKPTPYFWEGKKNKLRICDNSNPYIKKYIRGFKCVILIADGEREL